ncbi:MAG: hypothetical protein M3014_03965, partial [Chloroflexota bacterium]|nr:hypothetical protein [Chloroflexota bacterium]
MKHTTPNRRLLISGFIVAIVLMLSVSAASAALPKWIVTPKATPAPASAALPKWLVSTKAAPAPASAPAKPKNVSGAPKSAPGAPQVHQILCVDGSAAVTTGSSCTNLPTAYTTIQQAVTAAATGDEIRVAAGSYYDPVTFDKNLTLTGGYTGVKPAGWSTSTDSTSTQEAATLTINSAVQLDAGNYTMNGGTLQGTGTLNVPSPLTLNWTSGASTSGGGLFTIPVGAVLNLQANNSAVQSNGWSINNQGTTNWLSNGAFYLLYGAIFTNAGVFNLDADIQFYSYTNNDQFNNTSTGHIVKPSSTGANTINISQGSLLAVNNSGTFEIQTGTLNFSSGTFNLLAGTQFTNTAGNFIQLNGATFNIYTDLLFNKLALMSGSFHEATNNNNNVTVTS